MAWIVSSSLTGWAGRQPFPVSMFLLVVASRRTLCRTVTPFVCIFCCSQRACIEPPRFPRPFSLLVHDLDDYGGF